MSGELNNLNNYHHEGVQGDVVSPPLPHLVNLPAEFSVFNLPGGGIFRNEMDCLWMENRPLSINNI